MFSCVFLQTHGKEERHTATRVTKLPLELNSYESLVDDDAEEGHNTSWAIKVPLEMPLTPMRALSKISSVLAPKRLII